MADAKLKIVIDAVNNAKSELDGLKKQLEGIEAPTKKASTSLQDVGMALGKVGLMAGGAYVALKQVYDLGKSGAAIEQTTESFDRLGISIDSLRAASLGTVDDMTLMKATLTLTAGASETLQGKLLQAAPQLMEIAKAANALNPTLGDTAFMYESIATGVKRASPLILDNLGIVVKIEAANQAYAESLGKTVEEMTAEEKQIALLNATLEAGTRLIEQNGGSVESQADAYAKLQAETENAKAQLKMFADTLTGPVVVALGRGVSATMDAVQKLGALRVLVPLLAGDYGSFMTALLKANDAQEDATNAARANAAETERLTGLAEAYAEQQRLLATDTLNTAIAGEDSAEAWRQYSAALDMGNASITATLDASARAANALDAYKVSQQAASDAAGIAATAFFNAAAGLSEMTAAAFAKQALDDLKIALDDGRISQEDYATATEAVLTKFGLLTEAEKNAQGDLGNIQQAFLDGKVSAQQFADMLLAVKSGLDGLQDKEVNVRVIYTEEHRQMGAGAGQSSIGNPYDTTTHAAGGMPPGGWSLVGERGPELVRLPGGSQVLNHQVTNNVYNTYNQTVNTRATSGTVRQDFALLRALG